MQRFFDAAPTPFDFPNQQTNHFFEAILALNTRDECEAFFRDLCTLPELRTLSERWRIATLLWQGFPYRTIARKTKASSTTIARVSHWLQYGNGGLRKMCGMLADGQGDEEYQELKKKGAMKKSASLDADHFPAR